MTDVPLQRTYLELSDPASGSHKFYEVIVEGSVLTIRFGRIGTAGQIKSEVCSSAEEALSAAGRRVAEKQRKGYEAATPGVREKRPAPRRAGVSVEDQLAGLAACGISPKPGLDDDAVFAGYGEEDFERDPYSLLLMVLGGEAEEGPYGFPSSDVWHFDTECIEDHGDYARIAMRMSELAGGDLPLESVEDYVDVEAGRAWLAFELDDRRHKWALKVDSDWVDTNIFAAFDSLLRGRHANKRFTYLDLGGQDCLIGCSTPQQMEKLRATTGLDFRWLAE